MNAPFFTVIMPTYNRELFLQRSIESILNQTFADFELICIDDGSTDNSKEIIKKYSEKDQRIKYFYQKNQGRCIARNVGIENTKGQWVCFLDSDDIYFPNHLLTMVDLINKFPEYMAYSSDQLINDQRKIYKDEKLNDNYYSLGLNDLIRFNPISLNQLCYNASKILLRFPNENIPISEDWMFVRQLSLETKILKTNTPTTNVTVHPGRTMENATLSEIAKWNEYTSAIFIENNSIEKSIKRSILSHTQLLCANILLSGKKKRSSFDHFKKALRYPESYIDLLFYKALIKYLI